MHLLAPLPIPILRKAISAGQKPVRADCTRFAPTKAVSHNQLGLTQWARARLLKIMVPARIRMASSIRIMFYLLRVTSPVTGYYYMFI